MRNAWVVLCLVAVSACGNAPAVAVPDVVGERAEYAQGLLTGAGWHVELTESEDAEPASEPGTVVAQSVPAGSTVTGEMLTMTLTVAPDTVEVPDVTGLSLERAESELSKLGLDMAT